MRATSEFPVWRTPGGEPVSCVEKIKVLNENLAELRELAQEALEDAVLMGCDERQVREVLAGIVAGMVNPYESDAIHPSVSALWGRGGEKEPALVRSAGVSLPEPAGTAALLMLAVPARRFRRDDLGAGGTAAGARQDHRAGLEIRGQGRHRGAVRHLSMRVRDCEKNPPEETPENAAFVEIVETRPARPRRSCSAAGCSRRARHCRRSNTPVYDVNLARMQGARPRESPRRQHPAPPPADAGNTPR